LGSTRLPRLPAHRSCASRKTSTTRLVWLPSEDQKIIHAIGFHEILCVEQFVSGPDIFANDHIFTHAMIGSVAIAINDSDPSSWSKRGAKVPEQHNRMGQFVVGLDV